MSHGRWLLAVAAVCLLAALATACADDGQGGPPTVVRPLTATPTATPSATAQPSPTATEPAVTLAAVGDVMLGRTVGEAIGRYGADYPFQQVAAVLREADIAFANLEVPITAGGAPAQKDYVFRTPPEAAAGLAGAGLDIVSLANNHVLDYGVVGLADTLAALGQAGIAATGAGEDEAAARTPAILGVEGLRVAFLGYVQVPDDSVSGFGEAELAAGPDRPGVAWARREAVIADVEAAAREADLVVVSLHAGTEYQEEPSALQRELAHAAVDAGADLVLGHHPHVLQGIERYKGALIAYSLGNFVFDFDETDYAHSGLPSAQSLILKVTLGREGVRDFEVLPVRIDPLEARPYLVDGEDAAAVRARMERLSAALASP
jgi:poly-gamma-glutamate synthesis protein (capsule biosynthesis protein)